MADLEAHHVDWSRQLFNSLKVGGTWAVPRCGLVFRKRDSQTLVLIMRMPHDPAMPCTAERLAEIQRADYQVISRHFEAAGVTMLDESEGVTKVAV